MNIYIIFILLTNLKFFGTTAVYKDCGSLLGEVLDVTVDNCTSEDKACILKKNTNVTIEITFNTKELIEDVTVVVHGKVFTIVTPFLLPNDNGCLDSGLECPLSLGGPYKYVASLPILRSYPPVHVEVKWELQNVNKEDIVCLLIPAKINQ